MARIFVVASVVAAFALPAGAETLTLPAGSPILGQISGACPTCLDAGFFACGGRHIGYGRAFAPNALQGDPARGYLVTFVMHGAEFRALARQTPRDGLVATLTARFAAARLVVIGEDLAAARVLPAAPKVEVSFPEALHRCVYDTRKPWGCCVGGCGDGECCEKSLGSPRVELSWEEDTHGERLRFRFDHVAGGSTLTRETAKGRILYYCLTDGRGILR
ncbi:MAG: hypothetical protein HY246_18135 [Proteobacteria bacterium]|nr:hypothetical protein [Pseudomonadota bacterium]